MDKGLVQKKTTIFEDTNNSRLGGNKKDDVLYGISAKKNWGNFFFVLNPTSP